MARRGTGLILLGIVMVLGSVQAVRLATPFMDVFNFTVSVVVLLWGVTRRLEPAARVARAR